jgi:hypothetical protein
VEINQQREMGLIRVRSNNAGERSEIMYAQIESGIRALKEDLGRECDDIMSKIE